MPSYFADSPRRMTLTIIINRSELEKADTLEQQLRELSSSVKTVGEVKRFVPQPGRLVQFINLVAHSGVVYEVTGEVES